ncbi:MAG: HD domain-containing phosphohydrolase, partial [Dehalococcoidia bacterium]
PQHVQEAVRYTWEQWDGKGMAYRLKGEQTPVAARLLHLAQALVVAHSIGGKPSAEAIVTERSGTDFDPSLVEAFLAASREANFWKVLDSESVHEAVVRMQVPPSFDFVPEEKMDEVCEAIADFIDIRFQQTWNHSRKVASLAAEIARALKLDKEEITRVRRAGLVHDLGLAAVPSGAAALELDPSAESAEQVRQHPLHTKEVLRRVPAFFDLIPDAVGHHERYDGQGYPGGLSADEIPLGARILAVADQYVWLANQDSATSPDGALSERMRPMVGRAFCPNVFKGLEATLRSGTIAVAPRRKRGDPGLTERELEVLHSLATGLNNRQIANALTISEKTVQHHLDHIYAKLGVSSRTSAVVYGVQHGVI